jgi:hypothetical protein
MSIDRTDPRIIVWSSEQGPGIEHARILMDGSIEADVVAIQPPNRLRTILFADARWHTRTLMIDAFDGRPALVLVSDGEGRWFDGKGRTIDALDGCIDADVQASCFTNTLPIRRLGLTEGHGVEIRVAYVSVPELTVHAARQRYTLVRRTGDGSIVRFEGLESGFTAELEVDKDGFVVRYPGLARRA